MTTSPAAIPDTMMAAAKRPVAPSAIYAHHPSKMPEELAWAEGMLGGRLVLPCAGFVQIGGSNGLPVHANLPGSMLCPHTRGMFATIVVGRSLRLFRNNWSRAMLGHLLESLSPGGTLWVPCTDDRTAAAKGYWSVATLRELFGNDGELMDDGRCIGFRQDGRVRIAAAESILRWSFSNHGMLASLNADLGRTTAPLCEESMNHLLAPLLMPGDAIRVEQDPAALRDDPQVRARIEHESRLESEAYYIHGIGYKSALLAHIIRTQMPGGEALSLCDHGGGAGFLAAELLLDQSLPLREALCCDNWIANALGAHALLAAMRPQLQGRLRFGAHAAQRFEYRRAFDIITFIGSLLYVPKPDLGRTLDRAWEALNPGGLLVVHENIRNPTFVRDYGIMFGVQELDGLMSRYGTVRRYLSTATAEVSAEQAGEKTVFRVLQKPGKRVP